jgi:translation initiation factor eIF-2B subunit gamma
VLGKNTKIGLKAELFRCVTQAGYEVNAGGLLYSNLIVLLAKLSSFSFLFLDTIKNEKLETTDWTTALGVRESDDEGAAGSDT